MQLGGKIMNKLGNILVCCGVFFGLVALVSNEGAFACISSITAMTVGKLLIEAVQRQANKPT